MASSASSSGSEGGFDTETAWAWVSEHSRPISYAAGGVLVIVAVALFWRESVARKNERADTALATAQSAFYSGNTALAKSDLEKLVSRYPGTAGGTQAAILLAQILYGEGKHDDGINRLNAAVGSAPAHFAPALEELLASGFADTKRYDQAVEHLTRAADKAPFGADKAIYRAEAARLLALSGKTAEARKAWQALADDPESPVANEARVRIGELDAKAAGK